LTVSKKAGQYQIKAGKQ